MKFIFFAILAICIIGYIVYNRKQKRKIKLTPQNTPTTTIEGELPFSDVIAYFKNCNLKKGEDTPFICRESARTKEIFNIYYPEFELVGYKWLFIGAFNETTEEIKHYKVIYAKGFDAKLEDIFANEDLVVLE